MGRRCPLAVILAGCVSYEEGLAHQSELEERRIRGEIEDTAVVLEHHPVITLGHQGDASNVIASRAQLGEMGLAVHRTSRGGDVTYHGPGQVVMYPIVDLHEARKGQADFIYLLEETMIRATADQDVEAHRIEGKRGVFVGDDKVGAVGIHVSRGVTTHGLALNVDPDRTHFELIVPCGLQDHGVTSLCEARGSRINQADVEMSLVQHFAELMGSEISRMSIGW